MKQLRKSQSGMSLIEILLLLLLIIILILLGWYVWSQNNKNEPAAEQPAASSGQSTENTTVTADPTSDWVKYSNSPGEFSLKHPKTWVEFSSPEMCNEGLFLVGANANSVGKCATESFGQMAVASTTGDVQADSKLSSGYTNITEGKVTINGVTGVKQSGIASGQQRPESIIGGYEDGTKVVKYIFFTNNRTYTATYVQQTAYPDALNDFNLMVTKTLKFEA